MEEARSADDPPAYYAANLEFHAALLGFGAGPRMRRLYDYDAAWTWALSMTREERQARLRALTSRLDYQTIDLSS